MVRISASVFLVVCSVYTAVAYNATLHLVNSRDAIEDHYIVAIRDGFDVDFAKKFFLTEKSGIFSEISMKWTYTKAFNGFSAKIPPKALEKLRSMKAVKYIAQDAIIRVSAVSSWGLDRISKRNLPLDGINNSTGGDGSGVDVFVIDTGIYPSSLYFGNRAEVAFDAISSGGAYGIDCNGHGTHCAGTAAGNIFGVAPGAKVFGVRVLNCEGYGNLSDVVAGIDFVAKSAKPPSVASMSLGGPASLATDDATRGLVLAGVTVVAAAGNADEDACTTSPARVKEVITVGATDWSDKRASFSNYGTCVDIFAPGVEIPSAGIAGPEITKVYSGTSMACPHVSGAVAAALSDNPSMSPTEVKNLILNQATKDVITDPGIGSPNLLLFQP